MINLSEILINKDLKDLRLKNEDVLESEFYLLCNQLKGFLDYYNSNAKIIGVGLAAPQVGIHKNAAYINSGNGQDLFLINPVIVDAYDEIQSNEGCLSIPDRNIMVKRNNHVVIKDMLRPNGFILSGNDAVIAQHEIDHLNGVLIVDRLQTVVNKVKIGRNDPCFCGIAINGKVLKYKNCCMKG